MCSERERELYIQFEPEANEVVFGQRTAPDRPLSAKELSLRKKIILKLIDQQLKFELIELMTRKKEQEQTIAISSHGHSSSTSTDASSHSTTASTIPSNHHGYQNPNQQAEFGSNWQAAAYPQQCGIPNFYDSRPNFHFYKPFQNTIQTPLTRHQRDKQKPHRNQTNPNLVILPIQPSTNNDTNSRTSTNTNDSKGINTSETASSEKSPQNLVGRIKLGNKLIMSSILKKNISD